MNQARVSIPAASILEASSARSRLDSACTNLYLDSGTAFESVRGVTLLDLGFPGFKERADHEERLSYRRICPASSGSICSVISPMS